MHSIAQSRDCAAAIWNNPGLALSSGGNPNTESAAIAAIGEFERRDDGIAARWK